MAKAELKKHDLDQVYLAYNGVSILIKDGQEIADDVLVGLYPKYFSETTKVQEAPKEEAPKEEAPKEEAPKEEAPKEELLTEVSSSVEVTTEVIEDTENKELKVDFKKSSKK